MSTTTTSTYAIDVDALGTLVTALQNLGTTFTSSITGQISNLPTQLDAALLGTGAAVTNFEAKFAGWLTAVSNIETDVTNTYNALNTLLTDANNQLAALTAASATTAASGSY